MYWLIGFMFICGGMLHAYNEGEFEGEFKKDPVPFSIFLILAFGVGPFIWPGLVAWWMREQI